MSSGFESRDLIYLITIVVPNVKTIFKRI